MTGPTVVPPQFIPSGVLLTEWTTSTDIVAFAEGTETMSGSATVIAVSERECEFRFNHFWSAGDVGWPKELSLAGSLHLEPEKLLRIRLWTPQSTFVIAGVVCAVPAIWFCWTLFSGLLSGNWTGIGTSAVVVVAVAAIVKSSQSGARRFGEDALQGASRVAASA